MALFSCGSVYYDDVDVLDSGHVQPAVGPVAPFKYAAVFAVNGGQFVIAGGVYGLKRTEFALWSSDTSSEIRSGLRIPSLSLTEAPPHYWILGCHTRSNKQASPRGSKISTSRVASTDTLLSEISRNCFHRTNVSNDLITAQVLTSNDGVSWSQTQTLSVNR